MRRLLSLSAVLAWSILLRGEACGTEVGNKGVGEPCTRATECREGLVCAAGICSEVRDDGGADASVPGDAGPGDAASGG